MDIRYAGFDCKHRLFEAAIHTIIWAISFLLPLFVGLMSSQINWYKVFARWQETAVFFALFCLNNFVLAPKFLFRKKYWYYCILSAVSVILTVVILQAVTIKVNGPLFSIDFANAFFIATLIIFFNLSIKLIFKSIDTDSRMALLEKQSTQIKLDSLKNQIDPHFFMNTLNNIHALIDINTTQAKETVIELSKIMRFVLYDCNSEQISLWNCIENLNHYLQLMRIRFTNTVNIEATFPTQSQSENFTVPPLLFIPFLENAFKHGVSYTQPSYICSSMVIDNSSRIIFKVTNSKFPRIETNAANYAPDCSGIGLSNVKKRMDLLFGTNYHIETYNGEKEYSVLLSIPIQKADSRTTDKCSASNKDNKRNASNKDNHKNQQI